MGLDRIRCAVTKILKNANPDGHRRVRAARLARDDLAPGWALAYPAAILANEAFHAPSSIGSRSLFIVARFITPQSVQLIAITISSDIPARPCRLLRPQ